MGKKICLKLVLTFGTILMLHILKIYYNGKSKTNNEGQTETNELKYYVISNEQRNHNEG